MKKITSLLVMVVAMTLSPALLRAVNSVSYTVTYNSELSIGTDTLGGVVYSTVSYPGLYNDGVPGTPSLPVDYIKFSVPYNATNFQIAATEFNNNYQTIDNLVYPNQGVNNDDWAPSLAPIPPDSSSYLSGMYFPSSKAFIVDHGFIEGENRVVTIAIMPISCFSLSSRTFLKLSKRIVISLYYTIEDTLTEYPLIRRDHHKREEGYEFVKSLVCNPNDVTNNAPKIMNSDSLNILYSASIPIPTAPTSDTLDNTYEDVIYSNVYPTFDYMIITPDSLKHSLKRLAAIKRQMGYHVGIVTVEEIIHDHNSPWFHNIDTTELPVDSAKVIREYLKFAYGIGKANFLLLAGKDVPFKYGWYKTTPTDQYYSDLTSDWETSSKNLQPELFVGRIIARNEEQINNYTDKLFRYVLNPGNGDYSYLKRALYTNGYDVEVQGTTHTEIIRYQTDSIFPIATVMAENRVTGTPSGTDIINEINSSQYGLISFNNHGFPMGIVTYGRGGSGNHNYYWLWALEGVHAADSLTSHANDDLSTGNGLNNLTNKVYPSICFSTACATMPLDVMAGYDTSTVRFGESFTIGKDYGGPAYIGNTRNNGFEAAFLQRKIARSLRLTYPKLGVALAWAKAASRYTTSSNETQNLLGDPDLEVWTEVPQVYENIDIVRSNDSIIISGISADSTIISFYENNWYQRCDTVSQSNVVLKNISPNGTIMIYKHNYIPYIAPLLLQNINIGKSQYVIANDVVAGNSIDSNRNSGNVVVLSGVKYEIELSGKATLQDGFKVESGATFAVYPASF